LRHDDPRLDDQKASYVMAQEAASELETDTAVSRKDADIKARPEAAVKGITPNAPAPASQPRPARVEKTKTEAASTGGIFGFIKRLFSSSPAPEAKPTPSAQRGRNQNNRNGDRNRNRGRRGDRNDRGERSAEATPANAEGGTVREANGGRSRQDGRNRNRNQSNPKSESQSAVSPATEVAPGTQTAASADGEERRGRSRNRRSRGRGQRERGERAEGGNDAAITTTFSSASPFSGPPVGMAGASASMPIRNIVQSFSTAAVTQKERAPRPPREPRAPRQDNRSNASSNTQGAGIQSANVVAVTVSSIEVISKPMPELPKVSFQALEETPLHNVVQSAGMIWVATDASKHAQAQSQIQSEPEILHLGRAPKAPVSLPEGPMILVETGGQEKVV
jgi:ribonuclease E